VSNTLILVANRAAGWSVAADRLKTRQTRARWLVFALSIAGALSAAIASQIPTKPATGLVQIHQYVALAAALLLGLATLLSHRFLGKANIASWTRARAASEALKREGFRYAARAKPYDGDEKKADTALDAARNRIETAAVHFAKPVSDPGREGSAPRKLLKPEEYREIRVQAAIQKFYLPGAARYASTAKWLRLAELLLAIAATAVAACASAFGKTGDWFGVPFDLSALTAVLTTVSGAILAHIEASRLDHLVDNYSAAARRLQELDVGFDAASQDKESWSAYVNKCEDIIAAENASWTAKWLDGK
jgi:hypothetical protein